MKKYVLPLLLVLVMLFAVGCGKKAEEPAPADVPAPVETQEPAPTEEPEPSEEPEPTEEPEPEGYVYESPTYGFTITMPDEWKESCVIVEENGFIRFINADNQFLSFGDVDYEAGVLFTLTVGNEDMKDENGSYFYPSYEMLGKIGGEDFLVIYPTDVQYNMEDSALTESYRTMQDQVDSVLSTIIFG